MLARLIVFSVSFVHINGNYRAAYSENTLVSAIAQWYPMCAASWGEAEVRPVHAVPFLCKIDKSVLRSCGRVSCLLGRISFIIPYSVLRG